MRRFLNKGTGTVIQRIVTFEMKATRKLHYPLQYLNRTYVRMTNFDKYFACRKL